jgi:hypothetical protein
MSIFMNIRKSHLMIQGGAYQLAFPTGAMTPKNLPRRKERAMSNDTIELNFKAGTFEEAISQAIVAALGSGMSPREIIDQLIARGFLRDPGNNALEDVVRGLADMAEQMRSDRATLIG